MMWAMVTVGDVVAEETAVCEEHKDQGLAPLYGDVEDRTLEDCSDNSRLWCRVCEP